MKKSLFLRMLFVYLLVIIMAFMLVGGIFFSILRNNYLESQMNTMIADAKEINEWNTANYRGKLSLDDFANDLNNKAKSENTVIWLISNLGTVLYPDNKGVAQDDLSPDFLEAAQQNVSVRKISYNASGNTVITASIPLKVDETITGAIVVHREVSDFEASMGSIFGQVFFPLIISIAFASVLVFILSRYIVKPIKAVSTAATELSRGNLDFRVKPKTKDEIGELAVAFNKMAEELKVQDELRNTFIGNVSHELRTPLASVQGFIQGMLDGAIETEDRDKYLEVVLGETKRMSVLITDLLNLAKIESGRFPMEFSEFDINELIRRCLIMFEQRIEEKKLAVNVFLSDDKLSVWADQDRISQVVTNLIDNAVKFSYDGGELKIWTQCIDNKVYINIMDTGEGIPVEEQAYIFERFYKVDKSHSRNKPGTGIGLSIAKRIIAQHGEKITLQSAEGKGTTFTFTLTKALTGKTERTKTK